MVHLSKFCFRDPGVRIYLMLINTVCCTDFSEYLFNLTENKKYKLEQFTAFFAKKLDDYVRENIGIDF